MYFNTLPISINSCHLARNHSKCMTVCNVSFLIVQEPIRSIITNRARRTSRELNSSGDGKEVKKNATVALQSFLLVCDELAVFRHRTSSLKTTISLVSDKSLIWTPSSSSANLSRPKNKLAKIKVLSRRWGLVDSGSLSIRDSRTSILRLK